MIKNVSILVLISLFLLSMKDSPGKNQPKEKCPREKLALHISQPSVFTGEILWIKIYCTSSLFPKEEISTLAFIELVSPDNTSVIRKKVLLKNGCGMTDLLIPDNLSSGLYFIMAYTNWLKNFGEVSFFKKEIPIINPHLKFENKSIILDTSKNNFVESNINELNQLKILPDKKKYSTRELVTVQLVKNGTEAPNLQGNYSVSVFKKEPNMVLSTGMLNIPDSITEPEVIHYLPDYKGIIFSGKLVDSLNRGITHAPVIASFPGPGTYLKKAISDEKGILNFLFKPKIGELDVILSLPGTNQKVIPEEPFWNEYKLPPFNLALFLNDKAYAYLQEKYTHYQFQEGFRKQYAIKDSNTLNHADSMLFYSKPYTVLYFKDYIRLDSLREYFYELIPMVNFDRKSGKPDIRFISPVDLSILPEKPGIFIDGVYYNDCGEILNIPVDEIDRIAYIPDTYYYKDFSFGGIIDIHTRKSDFSVVKHLPNMTHIIHPIADTIQWHFSPPEYSGTNAKSRTPDFRYLLDWKAKIDLPFNGTAIHFYTGDLKGVFVVKVLGLTDEGEILESEQEILVDD